MRAGRDDPFWFHKGSAVYELVCRLYQQKLPYTEGDVCALLVSSKHDCGHGADVKPPYERAVSWARVNGVTPAWFEALRTFVDGLAGLRSSKANDLKTKASLVFLLDGERGEPVRCHSERFRTGLLRLPREERIAWERLVLSMNTALGARPSKDLDAQAEALIAFLGAEHVVARLDEWLPAPEHGFCRLETAGSHLIKNLVLVLLVATSDEAAAAQCDRLVERLVDVEFKPADRGKKVLAACALYLSRRPRELGRGPAARLLARVETMEKGSWDSDGIRRILQDYLSA
jgi:hypothetical protein